jgi:alkylation response protein AidB-like acyl-CoA dehydrogenase
LDLQYDTEQIILRDSVENFLRDHYDYKTYQRIAASETGFSHEVWSEFARLGWLGLPFAAEDGGVGGGAVETAILMEAFGRFLVIEPYVASVVLGGGLVAALGSTAERKALLAPLMNGTSRLAFAHQDHGAATVATAIARGFSLTGTKTFVLSAPTADTLLVSAQLETRANGSHVGVFIVPRNSPGLLVRPFRMIDGRRAADVELAAVDLPRTALLGGNEDAGSEITAVIECAIAALSADAVGAIGAMVKATIDYTKTRVQFGQPLAKFQTLQHRMVRMKVNEEEARASALFATLALDWPAGRRARAISGAKAKIGRCARFVHQNAIQLHGAIGTTSELPLGAYAKRLLAYEAQFGSTREHLRRYGALIANPELAADGLLAAAS